VKIAVEVYTGSLEKVLTSGVNTGDIDFIVYAIWDSRSVPEPASGDSRCVEHVEAALLLTRNSNKKVFSTIQYVCWNVRGSLRVGALMAHRLE
jgi:hypothetical protein